MRLADARDRARDMLALAKARKSPASFAANELAADIKRSVNTVEAVTKRFIVEYLEAKGRRPATVQQYRWLFDGKDLVTWRNRPIADITVDDVEAVLAAIMDGGTPSQQTEPSPTCESSSPGLFARGSSPRRQPWSSTYPAGETPPRPRSG